MRHKKAGKKLGVTKSHRKALLSNLAVSLIENKKIKTTLPKAKELSRFTDRMVTFGKKDTVAARRHVYKFLKNHSVVKTLFDEIAPTYSDRNGGYTRVLKIGTRPGDNAEMAIIELVGFHKAVKKKSKKAKEKKPKKEVETEMKTKLEEEQPKEEVIKEEQKPEEEKVEEKETEPKEEQSTKEEPLAEDDSDKNDEKKDEKKE